MKRTKSMINQPSVESRELALSAMNERALYPTIKSIVNTLHKHFVKGKYDPEKAPDAFYPVANQMAKIYARRFASLDQWNVIFSVTARYSAACELVEHFEEDIESGL